MASGHEVLMRSAAILDEADDIGAADAWLAAARLAPTPAMRATCEAHAIGVVVKHDRSSPFVRNFQSVLARAGTVSRSQQVALLGAAGESAGRYGGPLLAQAVVVLIANRDAWDLLTATVWERLLQHVDPMTDFAVDLCGVGWILSSLQSASLEYREMLGLVDAMLEGCASARGISIDQLRELIVPDPLERSERARELLAAASRGLRMMVPDHLWAVADDWIGGADRACALRPAGTGRRSVAHAPWTHGQYVTYFLERLDRSWVAISLTIAELDDGWLIVGDTKESDVEVQVLMRFDPEGDPGNPMRFQPFGTKCVRGADTDHFRAVASSTLLMNLLAVADLAGDTLAAGKAPRRELPCEVGEIHELAVPRLDDTMHHELSPRVPITGVATSMIPGSMISTVCSFGVCNPKIRSATFDDYFDLSNRMPTAHDEFTMSYPATWFLRPTTIERPVPGLVQHLYQAVSGGNASMIDTAVLISSGSAHELDQLEREATQRATVADHTPDGSRLVPLDRREIRGGEGVGFAHALEQREIDGFAIIAIYRDRTRGRLAIVNCVCRVMNLNPRRSRVLEGCAQPMWAVVSSFRFR